MTAGSDLVRDIAAGEVGSPGGALMRWGDG